jgi:hypothetical protein
LDGVVLTMPDASSGAIKGHSHRKTIQFHVMLILGLRISVLYFLHTSEKMKKTVINLLIPLRNKTLTGKYIGSPWVTCRKISLARQQMLVAQIYSQLIFILKLNHNPSTILIAELKLVKFI